jgi:hypothetical protein
MNVDTNDNGMQNDLPAGDGLATPPGTPGANDPSGSSIANQNGQPASTTPPGAVDLTDENKRLKGQISALQRQMIAARRSQGTPQNPAAPGGESDPASQAQRDIAVAYQLADGKLREQMESVYDLYPEITPKELSQIRRNPWAYCTRQTFLEGDVETAKLEIEQYIADLVESRVEGQPQPKIPSGTPVNPAPAPQPAVEQAVPGSDEDENDATMPMGKLEKKVQRIKANPGR